MQALAHCVHSGPYVYPKWSQNVAALADHGVGDYSVIMSIPLRNTDYIAHVTPIANTRIVPTLMDHDRTDRSVSLMMWTNRTTVDSSFDITVSSYG